MEERRVRIESMELWVETRDEKMSSKNLGIKNPLPR